jgi:hypothetical protein
MSGNTSMSGPTSAWSVPMSCTPRSPSMPAQSIAVRRPSAHAARTSSHTLALSSPEAQATPQRVDAVTSLPGGHT